VNEYPDRGENYKHAIILQNKLVDIHPQIAQDIYFLHDRWTESLPFHNNHWNNLAPLTSFIPA
jgi:hypothetical protein